jgi:hypothetical protein
MGKPPFKEQSLIEETVRIQMARQRWSRRMDSK